MLKDYRRALENLHKADVFEPNNASTLRSHGEVKNTLDDCQGTLDDYDKVNVIEPNIASILSSRGEVKKTLKAY
jgi:uncharacterized protein YutE (UPF0331/DUF86 family)